MEKDLNQLAQLVNDDTKGKIAYQEADLGTPVYRTDIINILDDIESYKLYTWDKVKDFIKSKYSQKLFFISHKEDEITGKPQLIEQNKKRIVLATKFLKVDRMGNEIKKIKFLDENVNRRDDGKEEETFSYSFFIYKIVDNKEEYVLWSERELKPELYRFKGMKIILKDNTEVSKTLKFDSQTNVFIAVEEESAIKVLDKENLIKHFKKLNFSRETFRDYIFTHPDDNNIYSHTDNYSKLMISFLLSGKYAGYPLHLFIHGPAGTGKSFSLECIDRLFKEDVKIFLSDMSTLKGLIPSFKEKPIHQGYVLNCVRISLIDELFKMIEKAEGTGAYLEITRNCLSQLNSLLEHRDGTVGSGTDTINIKATSKVIIMTNPYKTKRKLCEHIGLIDITTYSRALLLVQDYEERKHIDKKEIKKNLNKSISREDFLTIYDTCQSFLIDFDEEIVKDIFNVSKGLAQGQMRDLWRARGLHHSILLLDGLVKYRCLFEGDSDFKAKEGDYEALKEMLRYIIDSWECELREWEAKDGF